MHEEFSKLTLSLQEENRAREKANTEKRKEIYILHSLDCADKLAAKLSKMIPIILLKIIQRETRKIESMPGQSIAFPDPSR